MSFSRGVLHVRHVAGLMGCALGLAFACWLAGQRSTALPSLVGDAASFRLWTLGVWGLAILPALSLHSDLHDLEEASTDRLKRAEWTILLSMSMLCGVGAGAAIFFAESANAAFMALRLYVGVLGCALLSGTIFSPIRSWALPAALLVALMSIGSVDSAAQWWQIDRQAPGRVSGYVVSASLLIAGLTSRLFRSRWSWRGAEFAHREATRSPQSDVNA